MKTTLCTLYNSLYLDKGLVLYDSLKECAKDFELYVLCMDEKCYEVISDIGEESLKPIHLYEVENEEMLTAKGNRSTAEYCWTCSSRLIKYILETYQPESCTYIDADMYFYHDPQILVDEMIASDKSVMMVPHRFSPKLEHEAKRVGIYCVEFNCFKNDEAALKVLNHWHHKCLECCKAVGDGIYWGDQKYMDEWTTLFPDAVHPCEHPGAGIAPWNVELYKDIDTKDYSLLYKKTGTRVKTVFYHYQSVTYLSRREIRTGIEAYDEDIDYNLINNIYNHYLVKIEKKKQMMESKYGIDFLITLHPAKKRAKWKSLLLQNAALRSLIYKLNHTKPPYVIVIDTENV